MPVYRLRNWFVDARIRRHSYDVPKPEFPPHLTPSGQLKLAECHGPLYPQSVADMARLYMQNRFRVTRKLLYKVGRVRAQFRGIVHFTHPECAPVYVMEFYFPGGSVFVVFQDAEYVEGTAVRVVVRGRVTMHEFFDLLGTVADRFEYALLPKEVRIADGGRSLSDHRESA
jgi:hypothetical protein